MIDAPIRLPTKQIIFEAIQDLHSAEQVVTREALVAVTGLKLTIVDDQIGTLIEGGQVLRVRRGVFVPAPSFPTARAISTTFLPDGLVKLEVGDDCLSLTPREARMLGRALAGHALEFSNIRSGYEAVATRSARQAADKREAQDEKATPF